MSHTPAAPQRTPLHAIARRAAVSIGVVLLLGVAGCVPLPPAPDPVDTTPAANDPSETESPSTDGGAQSDDASINAWIATIESQDLVHSVEWTTGDGGVYHIAKIQISDDMSADDLRELVEIAIASAAEEGIVPIIEDCLCAFVSDSSGNEILSFRAELPEATDAAFEAWEWAQQLASRDVPTLSLANEPAITVRLDEDDVADAVTALAVARDTENFFTAGIEFRLRGHLGQFAPCSWVDFEGAPTTAERDVINAALTNGLAGVPEVCVDLIVAQDSIHVFGVYDDGLVDAPSALDEFVAALESTGAVVTVS